MSNALKLVILGLIILTIPVGVKLAQQQQIIKSRASYTNDAYTCTQLMDCPLNGGGDCRTPTACNDNKCVYSNFTKGTSCGDGKTCNDQGECVSVQGCNPTKTCDQIRASFCLDKDAGKDSCGNPCGTGSAFGTCNEIYKGDYCYGELFQDSCGQWTCSGGKDCTGLDKGKQGNVGVGNQAQNADDGLWCTSGRHKCNFGAITGTCTDDKGRSCTKYDTYQCEFNGVSYCSDSGPNKPTCGEPCTGTDINQSDCETARKGLDKADGKEDGSWNGKSCEEIKNKVCNDCSLFKGDALRTRLCGAGDTDKCKNIGDAVKTKCGDTKTWIEIDDGLKKAGWDETPKHDQHELDEYNAIRVCPGNPAQPNQADACTVTQAALGQASVDGNTVSFSWTHGQNKITAFLNVSTSNATDGNGVLQLLNTVNSDVTNTTSYKKSGLAPGKYYWNIVTDGCSNPVQRKATALGTFEVAQPPANTVAFRVAESPSGLSAASWEDYKTEPVLKDYEFKDKTPGLKTLFIQFKDTNGKESCGDKGSYCTAQIKLLGPDPAVTACSLSIDGDKTTLNLSGQNFGLSKGSVKRFDNNSDLEVKSWKDDEIQATWTNAPLDQTLSVNITNTDGQTVLGQCSSISQLALGAKVFCRAPASHQTDKIDLTLAEASTGAKVVKQKISIDKDGIVQGLTQKLVIGKQYNLSLRAPHGLRKTVAFTVEEGTNNIPSFVLPAGDIYPTDGGDGKINPYDYLELKRQFTISKDVTGRTADFNQDNRVNSFDWACMKYDWLKEDDPEVVAGILAGKKN